MTSIKDHTQEDNNIQCISVNQANYVLAFLTYIIMVMMTMIVIIIIIRRRRMMMMMMMEIKFVYQLPHFFYMFRTY